MSRVQVFTDRQHRSGGCNAFPFMFHKPGGVEYCIIYPMKSHIFLYPIILKGKSFRVYFINCKVILFIVISVLGQLTEYLTPDNNILQRCSKRSYLVKRLLSVH